MAKPYGFRYAIAEALLNRPAGLTLNCRLRECKELPKTYNYGTFRSRTASYCIENKCLTFKPTLVSLETRLPPN